VKALLTPAVVQHRASTCCPHGKKSRTLARPGLGGIPFAGRSALGVRGEFRRRIPNGGLVEPEAGHGCKLDCER